MIRTLTIPTTLSIILVALAGCTNDATEVSSEPLSGVEAESPTNIHRFNGTSMVSEIAVCAISCYDGLAYVAVGDSHWESDGIKIPENFTYGFVTVTWEMTTQDVHELQAWVYHDTGRTDWRKNYGVANGTGKSPITISFSKDDLKDNAGLAIGFTMHSPVASVLMDQEVQWDVVLLSTA